MRRAISTALALAVTTGAGLGGAWALTQPNGARIPSDPGCSGGQMTGLAATFACECDQEGVCNVGAVCPSPTECDDGMNGTCETTVWHSFNDNTCIPSNLSGLDPVVEAATEPETFRPTCALTFTVVTRGTAIFRDVFGWYNVTGAAPDPSDLHVMLDCDDAAGSVAVLDIQSHPAYRGGEIGFFLLTPEGPPGQCAAGDCCASLARHAAGVGRIYYSQRAFNPDDGFIHLLVYDSHVTPQKFYFAWEDIFGGSNNDFTDLVTSVEGVECSGGGSSCDTGASGLCARGVLACEQGVLGCHPLFAPTDERCNGLDDDCDGSHDEGAECPELNHVCHDGRCVPHCETSAEFDCPVDLVCDSTTGRCVSPGCEGSPCPDGTVCRDGMCVAPCDGVSCPDGETCVGDACIDLCAGVTCAAGDVCSQGVCLPGCHRCGGIACDPAETCDLATGVCLGDEAPPPDGGTPDDPGVGPDDGDDPRVITCGGCIAGRRVRGVPLLVALGLLAIVLRLRRRCR